MFWVLEKLLIIRIGDYIWVLSDYFAYLVKIAITFFISVIFFQFFKLSFMLIRGSVAETVKKLITFLRNSFKGRISLSLLFLNASLAHIWLPAWATQHTCPLLLYILTPRSKIFLFFRSSREPLIYSLIQLPLFHLLRVGLND
jgi:hypothetical protein